MTKKILYGTSNFEAIITENGYYIDKTQFVEKIENLGARYLLFLRPRRFGKSLFISTLEYYYGINHADKFDELFGNLYIGKNPTPLKNFYPILKLNLSSVISHGTLEEIEDCFNARIWSNLNSFFEKYQEQLSLENIMQSQITPLNKASSMFARFIDYLADKKIKFYLLIDEYDNFANNILADHGKNHYQQITHGTGFLRNFFTVIKAGTDSKTIDRMFATGVSPLLMSDVTSGFNIGENISQNPYFNEMAGFTEPEVRDLVKYYISEKQVKKEDEKNVLTVLHNTCNNYKFSPETDIKLYNSNSVLYLIYQYMQVSKIPAEVVDSNMKTDYQKLRFLVIESQKLNGNFRLLSQILQESSIISQLIRNFSLSDLIEKDRFISFLYYLGFLTIEKQMLGQFVFSIPNEMCKEILWEYIRKSLSDVYCIDLGDLQNKYLDMALHGNWESLFKYIFEEFYKAVSNRDFIYREEGVKGFVLAYLNISKAYRVYSEPELNKGYADIYIAPNDMIYPEMCSQHFLVELKYIRQSEITPKNRKKLIDTNVKQAKSQLEQYAKDHNVPSNALKIIAITTNEELITLMSI